MYASLRYRDKAVDCLLAARNCPPHYHKIYLSLAAIWLSLANQDEAMNGLLASRDPAKPVKTDRLEAHPRPLLYLVK
jgi:hypothetical protein